MRDWIADARSVDEVVRVDVDGHSATRLSRTRRTETSSRKHAKTIFSTCPGSASASSAPTTPPRGAERAEAEREPEIADAAAAEHEAADDRGGEDHEQRRRLGRVLREPGGEREERHHQRPAADAEQPGRRRR